MCVISFESKYGFQSYHCDRFDHPSFARRSDSPWKSNVRAIALGLEALRKVERYGIADSGQQYRGWQALGSGAPMPAATGMTHIEARDFIVDQSNWMGEFDPYDAGLIGMAYKMAAKLLHPDRSTGDAELFKQLEEAKRVLIDVADRTGAIV